MGKIIKAQDVTLAGEKEIGESISNSGEPQIRLNKKNGIVESIDITCSCGKKIHIICEYESRNFPAYHLSGSQLNAPTIAKEKSIAEEAPQ